MLCVMRHSVRRDDATAFSEITDEMWADRHERPYDPPLSNLELPCIAAEAMLAAGLEFDVVATSPYRRCLQTAGIVAARLGVRALVVDNRLSEHLDAARRGWRLAGVDERAYAYVESADAARWAGLPEAQLLWRRQEHAVLEHPDDVSERVNTLPAVCAEAAAWVAAWSRTHSDEQTADDGAGGAGSCSGCRSR